MLFILWFIYMLICRLIFKIFSLAPYLVNKVWYLLFLIFNNLIHVLHKTWGAKFSGVDQSVTDVFGGVYLFVDRITKAIENACYKKDSGGNMTKIPKKPFVGAAFLIAAIMVVWIAAPAWLHITDSQTVFTSAYHKYVEVEGGILDMVFGEK